MVKKTVYFTQTDLKRLMHSKMCLLQQKKDVSHLGPLEDKEEDDDDNDDKGLDL